jgi:hypothetical protein
MEPAPIDVSNPNALFKVSRQRLLDEAVRIDAISRRNLGIGILFSSIALAVLAWPVVSTVFLPDSIPAPADLNSWGLLRMYLPRFSVGLLLIQSYSGSGPRQPLRQLCFRTQPLRPRFRSAWLGLSIGVAVASGRSLLKWEAPSPRRVLVADGEMPLADLQARLNSILLGLGVDVP